MIPILENVAKKTNAKIAIGVSKEERAKYRTINAVLQAKRRGFVNPILVGENLETYFDFEIINSPHPEKTLINLVLEKNVDGAVRGSFKANVILKELRSQLKLDKNVSSARFALVQHPLSGRAMYLAPVGIEEGRSFKEKEFIVTKGIELLQLIGIDPVIDVLAAGISPDDIGRDEYADKTISDAEKIINLVKEKQKNIDIKTSGIQIENALEEGANLIIFPDGINGNLLYRSLVHITDWKSFGAIFAVQNHNLTDFIFIDTSSIGTIHEYRRALMFASAIVGSQ